MAGRTMTRDGRPPRSAVRAAVRMALADLVPGDRVLVALSGGADSLALLAATLVVSAQQGFVCGAVIVDHGLQEGSAKAAARAAEQARILGCSDVRVVRVDVARGPGSGGVEAAARAARYAALEAAAVGTGPDGASASASASGAGTGPDRESDVPAAAILLGHTRDDQAETVLLGLARGSGTRAIAGMAPQSGLYRRPLLGLPREVVARAAADAADEDPRLAPWADPHNDDRGFARVRVRREVLPVLEAALGPGVAEALARTADLARRDADALDDWADRVWGGLLDQGLSIPVGAGRTGDDESGRLSPEVRAEPSRFLTSGTVVGVLPIAPLVAAPLVAAPGDALQREPGAELPAELPPAVVARVVRRFLVAAGCPAGALTADHISAVAALLRSPGSRAEVALPGGRRTRREGDDLVVRT